MVIEFWVLFGCLVLSAFFSSSETAFVSVSQMRIAQLVEKKVPGASIIKKLKEEPSKFISTLLVGNNIVNIGASVLATAVIISFFHSRGEASLAKILTLSTIIMTLILIIFGEIIPKTAAIRNAEKIVLLFAWPMLIVSIILTPIASILTIISKPFIFLFGGKILENGPFLTEEDLKYLIKHSERDGILEKKEREMISSIFDFADTTVKEVMTPRLDIKAIEESSSMEELLQFIKETGHSRIPVYEKNLDNIIGAIYAKDLLNCSRSENIKNYMRSIIFIPEGKKVDELLRQMQSTRTHIAIVVDEYGVTAGIISLEDIVEEIVGEIHDEFESKTEKQIEKISENVFTIDGKMLIEDINRELEISLPTNDDYDTLAGFIVHTLVKMPSVGDIVKHGNVEIRVDRVLKRRITRVKLQRNPVPIEDAIVGG